MKNGCNILLVLDLDGTIIFPGDSITSNLVKYLKYYNDNNLLLIATARHPIGVRFVFNKYFDFIPTLSLNGGGLHLNNWDIFDRSVFFDFTVIRNLKRLIKQYNDVTMSFYGKKFWYVNKITKRIVRESKITGMQPIINTNYGGDGCIKLLLTGDDETLKDIQNIIRKDYYELVSCNKSNLNYLELSPSNVNKTLFIDVFIEYFAYERKDYNIVFVGDSENDIEMAKYSDEAWTYSYAPNNLKKHCKILTLENGEGLHLLLTQLGRQHG